MTTSLIKAGLSLLRMMPLSWARRTGRWLGKLVWALHLRERHIAQVNIQLAFPHLSEREQTALAKRSVEAAGEWFSELGRVWQGSRSELDKLVVQVRGADYLAQAQAEGQGVVFLAPHMGNWEFVGLYINTLIPLSCLYEPPEQPGLEEFIVKARGRFGMTTFPTTPKGVVGLTRALKSGRAVGVLPDQVPRDISAGCNASFMGQMCFTPTLAVKLAQRTGARLFYLIAYRVDHGFEVLIQPADDAIYTEDLTVAMTVMNRGIAELLAPYPEQYQWTYKRFRVRPQQGPNPYHRGN
jgi:KDO2-lipid IV(A) lauroyltransferase